MLTRGAAAASDVTLESYRRGAARYADLTAVEAPAPTTAFINRICANLAVGQSVLELGSGTGRDALIFERHGLQVRRTDAVKEFVEILQRSGHSADLLDARRDFYDGPYEVVFANAVFLHFTESEFRDVLARSRESLRNGGELAFTVKQGVGSTWTHRKLGQPRYFQYWERQPLLKFLSDNKWEAVECSTEQTLRQAWLFVRCRLAR